MRVTFDEIAKIANVSKATVSRVLNNSPKGVSDETRKRVQKIIKDMNYELRGREPSMWTRTIALVIPDITNPFFSELAKEVENSASDNNYYVVLVNTEFSEERECEYLIRLLTKKIDGIILVPSGSVVRQEHLLPQKYNIPLLLLDRKLRGEHSFVGVYTDSEYAAFKSCELMIKNGSREIAFIGGTPNASTSIERLNGYKAAMTHFNINYNINLIRQGNYTVESGYDAVMELAKQNITVYSDDATVSISFPWPYLKNSASVVSINEDEGDGGVNVDKRIVASYDEAYRSEWTELVKCFRENREPELNADGAAADIAIFEKMIQKFH